jgi:cell division protease FtsH
MVCEWGMSDAMGPLTFGKKEEQIFLGREIAQHQDYSEDTAIRIDQEIKRIVTENYERSHQVLSDARDRLITIADALLVREVLDAEQVQRMAKGEPLEEPAAVPAGGVAPAADSKERPAILPSIPKPVPQE